MNGPWLRLFLSLPVKEERMTVVLETQQAELRLPRSMVSASLDVELDARQYGHGLLRITADPKARRVLEVAVSSDLVDRGFPTSLLSSGVGPAPRMQPLFIECVHAESDMEWLFCAINVLLRMIDDALSRRALA